MPSHRRRNDYAPGERRQSRAAGDQRIRRREAMKSSGGPWVLTGGAERIGIERRTSPFQLQHTRFKRKNTRNFIGLQGLFPVARSLLRNALSLLHNCSPGEELGETLVLEGDTHLKFRAARPWKSFRPSEVQRPSMPVSFCNTPSAVRGQNSFLAHGGSISRTGWPRVAVPSTAP